MRPAGIPDAAVNAEGADLIAGLEARGRVRMHLTLLGVSGKTHRAK